MHLSALSALERPILAHAKSRWLRFFIFYAVLNFAFICLYESNSFILRAKMEGLQGPTFY